MTSGQQPAHLGVAFAVTCAVALSLSSVARAQDDQHQGSSSLTQAIKFTLIDPTTYVPGIFNYQASMRDWQTSQIFFQNGYGEHSSEFTLSGLPNGVPVDYGAGRARILRDSLEIVALSAGQNVASRLIEDSVIARHPEHRKLVRTLGWVERVSLASALSYWYSVGHYRQTQLNQQRAAQLGLR
jgi:hypothetical protein